MCVRYCTGALFFGGVPVVVAGAAGAHGLPPVEQRTWPVCYVCWVPWRYVRGCAGALGVVFFAAPECPPTNACAGLFVANWRALPGAISALIS